MPTTRRTVLEQLAAESDARRRETISIKALASALDVEEQIVEVHLNGLQTCELAHIGPDGRARVTITGEELLEIDTDEMVIVDSSTPDSG
jgi:Mn-dependent DtxR family transcriptional regulator